MRTQKYSKALYERVLFTAVPLLLLLGCYAFWALNSPPDTVAALVASALLTFLFILCGVRFIPQWMAAWSRQDWLPLRAPEGKRSGRPARLHPTLKILLALCLARILVFVLAYGILLIQEGYNGGVFDNLSIWNRVGSDSRHYLNIAENWYAADGDDRLLIVFMPLYPILVRVFRYIFEEYLVSGLFVSNLCCVFAGYVFYELALIDHDRDTAMRSLKYLCILPAAFLLSAPLSDSLFLLLSVSCIYMMRKDRYVLAGIYGGLAAFTRAPGILLFAPVCFELVGRIIRELPGNRNNSKWALRTVGRAAAMLLIPLGFGLYLLVNRSVTGNPFMFLTYQQAHWHQQMGWFFASAATQTDSALTTFRDNREMVLGLWIPNLVYLFASLGLVTAAQNKLRASNVAYFIAYYAVCMGATWLLSAPRYLTACYPLALALGTLTEKKWADATATLLCLGLGLYYLFAFVNQWYVY